MISSQCAAATRIDRDIRALLATGFAINGGAKTAHQTVSERVESLVRSWLGDAGPHLLAVHTDGTCATDGSGTNWGWSAASIVAASAYLQDADIADR
jgi:uncharacterized membrane protein